MYQLLLWSILSSTLSHARSESASCNERDGSTGCNSWALQSAVFALFYMCKDTYQEVLAICIVLSTCATNPKLGERFTHQMDTVPVCNLPT